MKKKMLSLFIAGAMLASTSAAFAIETDDNTPPIDMIQIKENPVTNYMGTVKAVDENVVTVDVETENETVQAAYGVTEETPVYDAAGKKVEELKAGDKVIIATESNLLTKDIKPVKAIVVNNEKDKAVNVYYDKFSTTELGFISSDNGLVLNIEDDKKAEYEGKTLLVIYELATMSIPPQTNPIAVAVIEDGDREPIDTMEMKKYIGAVKSMDEKNVTVEIDGVEYVFVADEIADNIAVGDEVEVYSTAALETKDIKTAAKVVKTEKEKVSISFKIGDSVLNINGEEVKVEKPYIAGEGTTLVPVRVISEAFGAKVDWVETENKVTITFDGKSIELTIDDKTAVIDGDEAYELEEAPRLENGTTMVPIRFISESFGAKVGWDEATEGITVELN